MPTVRSHRSAPFLRVSGALRCYAAFSVTERLVVHFRPKADMSSQRGVGFDRSKATFLSYLDDDLAFCTPSFEVSHRLVGRLEWKDSIHNGAYGAGLDEASNLAQLPSACFHEEE